MSDNREKINWGKFFSDMSKDWQSFMDENLNNEDIRCFTDDEEYRKMLAEANEYPETACYASNLKKVRLIAKTSEKAMKAIGKCIDGAAALFNKKH